MQLTELVTLQAKGMYVNHTACTWEGLEHAPPGKIMRSGIISEAVLATALFFDREP